MRETITAAELQAAAKRDDDELPQKFVYVVGGDDPHGPHKIGICNRPHGEHGSRIVGDLQRGNWHDLTMWDSIELATEEMAKAAEKHCHAALRPHWIRGEWFRVDRETAIVAAHASAEEIERRAVRDTLRPRGVPIGEVKRKPAHPQKLPVSTVC